MTIRVLGSLNLKTLLPKIAPSGAKIALDLELCNFAAMLKTTLNQVSRTVLLLLALMAFVAQSAIPVGFMPDFGKTSSAHEIFSLVICSGDSEKTIYVDSSNHEVPTPTPENQPAGHDKAQGKTLCPYAPVLAYSVHLNPNLDFIPVTYEITLHGIGTADFLTNAALYAYHAQAPPLA